MQVTPYLVVEYYFFIIMFNALIYTALLSVFFAIFFLFDYRLFRTLNEYKFFRTTGFINTSLVILFLSLAGIPPLAGFLSKFLLFYLLFLSKIQVFIISMLIFNLFVMYFYLQNIRFVYSKKSPIIFFFSKFRVYLNFPLIVLLSLGLFLNTSSIFFFEYLLTIIHQFILSLKIF